MTIKSKPILGEWYDFFKIPKIEAVVSVLEATIKVSPKYFINDFDVIFKPFFKTALEDLKVIHLANHTPFVNGNGLSFGYSEKYEGVLGLTTKNVRDNLIYNDLIDPSLYPFDQTFERAAEQGFFLGLEVPYYQPDSYLKFKALFNVFNKELFKYINENSTKSVIFLFLNNSNLSLMNNIDISKHECLWYDSNPLQYDDFKKCAAFKDINSILNEKGGLNNEIFYG